TGGRQRGGESAPGDYAERSGRPVCDAVAGVRRFWKRNGAPGTGADTWKFHAHGHSGYGPPAEKGGTERVQRDSGEVESGADGWRTAFGVPVFLSPRRRSFLVRLLTGVLLSLFVCRCAR